MTDPTRVGYLTGEYPRATDAWIQREIAALRDSGVIVDSFAIRRPDDQHMVGPEQRNERSRTTYLYQQLRSAKTVTAHLNLARRSPRRYLNALRLAWQTKRDGIAGTAYQFAYFLEAGLLASELQQRGITHLHNHFGDSSCTVAMLSAELGGTTYSFTLHGPGIFFEPYTWRLDEKLKRAAFCACISYFCRSQAAIFADPDDLDRLHIIHCGVDPAALHPVTHSGSGSRLLFVARLAELKGLSVLMEAMAVVTKTHPDVQLTVVGDGPERGRFEKLSRRLNLEQNVHFAGYRNQAEVAEHLAESDIFVLPSYAEGVPVTLMEAMGSGLPVIATQVGGVSELVEHGVNGYIVRPGEADELAHSIKILVDDPDTRSSFGTAGRAKVEADFNNQREAARLDQLFRNTAAGLPSPLRPELPA